MFATQVLPDTYFEDKTKKDEDPEIVGYLIIDEKKYQIKKGENKIGRDSDCCSIFIQNCTVSKLHAIIESDGVDDTFVYDVGSTNQTRLGKKCLKPHCRYKIENGSVLTLGNVLAKFTTPTGGGDALKSFLATNTPPNSGENATSPAEGVNELGDIFDISTELQTPQPCCSKNISNFEKLPENFHVFKVPKKVPESIKESPGTSQSIFDLVTQCQLTSLESPKSQQNHCSGFEDSHIFSLTTQCQLPESPKPESTKDENVTLDQKQKDSDGEKIESLLNDGQDDVLCTFMSIHSPNEQNNLIKASEIKTEVTSPDSEIFNATTQLPSQDVNINRQEMEHVKDLLADNNFGEDVCDSAKARHQEDGDEETQLYDVSPCKEPVKNPQVYPEEEKIKLLNTKNITAVLPEKQKSPEKSKNDGKKTETGESKNIAPDKVLNLNLSQTSTESYLEITLDDIQFGDCEDTVPTLKHTTVENERLSDKVGEGSDAERDLIQTEVFDPQRDIQQEEGAKEITKYRSLVVEESSDDESYLEKSLECSTQRCDNDDFISTQLFSSDKTEKDQNKKKEQGFSTESSLGRINEDFISTQQLQEKNPRNENSDTSIESPSMIDRDNEDFIATQQIHETPKTTLKRRRIDCPEISTSSKNYKPVQNCESDSVSSPLISETDRDKEDFIATQQMEPPRKITHKNFSLNSGTDKGSNFSANSSFKIDRDEEDFFTTQQLQEPPEKIISGNHFSASGGNRKVNTSVDSPSTADRSHEDFIATQQLETPVKRNLFQKSSTSRKSIVDSRNSDCCGDSYKDKSGENLNRKELSLKRVEKDILSPDFLSFNHSQRSVDEDFQSTQIFEAEKGNERNQLVGISKSIASLLQRGSKDKNDYSSGDETESDLEILEEIKFDVLKNNIKEEKESDEKVTLEVEDVTSQSNDSYVFQLDKEKEEKREEERNREEDKDKENWRPLTVVVSDSDCTDCEEAEAVNPPIRLKVEHVDRTTSEGTQVLTLSLPDDYAGRSPDSKDDWMVGDDSPKFEVWNVLTSELPAMEDIQGIRKEKNVSGKNDEVYETPSKKRRVEVRNKNFFQETTKLNSPLKRERIGDCVPDVLPIKKSRTVKNTSSNECLKNNEKKLSKLWQAHDITQIQTTRTRQSKGAELNKILDNSFENSRSNRASTSSKKSNPKRRSNKKQKESTPKTAKKSCYSRRKIESAVSIDDFLEETERIEPKTTTRVLRSTRKNSGSSLQNGLRQSTRTKTLGFCFRDPCVRVVFTGFDCESLDKIIASLGGVKCNDVASGEVVVTDKVRRTVKLLSAIGLGLPIVSPEWLLSCRKENHFLNPWNSLLKDEEAEEKWDFELKTSLEKAKKKKLLEGYSVFATENTKPPVKELLGIVECCGGTPLQLRPEIWPRNTIFVSCLEDKKCWPLTKFRQVKVVHYEFILSGVLRQKLDFKTHKLR